MEGESIVKIYCECKATNYVFLGNQEDVTGPEYYFFECWSCHKYGLLAEEWAIRDILMLDKNKNIMEEAPSYSSEGHRFPEVDDWVESFLDEIVVDGDKGRTTIRGKLVSNLQLVFGQPLADRQQWTRQFIAWGGEHEWPQKATYNWLRELVLEKEVRKSFPDDDEDQKLIVTRRIEDVMTRLLYLEGCP